MHFEQDDTLVVEMIQVGPHDPLCCPTQPTVLRLAYRDGALEVVDEWSATIDAHALGRPVRALVVPAAAYDNTRAPEGRGEPLHFAWVFDNGTDGNGPPGRIAVYPVRSYLAMGREAGDPRLAQTLDRLRRLLVERPSHPPPPLPIVPLRNGTNDLAARVAYLDLGQRGTGMRFVGRFAQDATPLSNASLRYVFWGLVRNGEDLVVADLPVRFEPLAVPQAAGDPSFDPARTRANLDRGTQLLDAAPASQFSPGLATLDGLVASVRIVGDHRF